MGHSKSMICEISYFFKQWPGFCPCACNILHMLHSTTVIHVFKPPDIKPSSTFRAVFGLGLELSVLSPISEPDRYPQSPIRGPGRE